MIEKEPFVSIITPVYNGEEYLTECIESILAQTYINWEYIIVNNCSTDNTLEIADSYANKDKRIKIICNERFVNAEENHNIAFTCISKRSSYCKVVSADDTITPDCLEKMVSLASANPSVGIVGSYQIRGNEVRWTDMPLHINVLSGREACRFCIMQDAQIFGNPTSELYASDMIRKNIPFYPSALPYADISACYKYLRERDFGFVHAILSMERIHEKQISSSVRKVGMDTIGWLDNFLTYGSYYLSKEEYKVEKIRKIKSYHRWLGGCLLKLYGIEFWKYQSRALKELGTPISWHKVLRGAMDEVCEEMKNPRIAIRKALKILNGIK